MPPAQPPPVRRASTGTLQACPRQRRKGVGIGACRNGEGLIETSGAIYCEIPVERRRLGNLTASKALLEFAPPNHLLVNKIRLTFEASADTIKAAMVAAYGKPTEDDDFFYWENGADTSKLYKSGPTCSVRA